MQPNHTEEETARTLDFLGQKTGNLGITIYNLIVGLGIAETARAVNEATGSLPRAAVAAVAFLYAWNFAFAPREAKAIAQLPSKLLLYFDRTLNEQGPEQEHENVQSAYP